MNSQHRPPKGKAYLALSSLNRELTKSPQLPPTIDKWARFDADEEYRNSVKRKAVERVRVKPAFVAELQPLIARVGKEAVWQLLNTSKWHRCFEWECEYIVSEWQSNRTNVGYCARCEAAHEPPFDVDCTRAKRKETFLQRERDGIEAEARRIQAQGKRGRPPKWASDADRMRAKRALPSGINEQTPNREEEGTAPSVDQANSDAKYWNQVLAKEGLGIKRGRWMTDAAQGTGVLTTGGYDSTKAEQVHDFNVNKKGRRKATAANFVPGPLGDGFNHYSGSDPERFWRGDERFKSSVESHLDKEQAREIKETWEGQSDEDKK